MAEEGKSRLGRGLAALIGEVGEEIGTLERKGFTPRSVPVEFLRPNPRNPRKTFKEYDLDFLAGSIRQRGIIQPIVVREGGAPNSYEIIAGERRWRAAQMAGLHEVPVTVLDVSERQSLELAIVENVQRADLNPIEEAEAYRQLIDRYGHTQDEVARLVHKSRSHVANLLRLLDLPPTVRDALLRGEITMGHARAVASCDDAEALVREIVEKGLSVRQAEALAKRVRPGAGADIARASARNARPPVDADIAALERHLGDVTGLKVRLAHNGSSGTVTLSYSSLDQLDMICQRLSGEPI